MEESRGLTNLFLDVTKEFKVNVEKSLKVGDSLGGHYVTGEF